MTQIPPTQENQPLDGPHIRFEDFLLDKLMGEWILSRKIRNHLEENHVMVDWILNHQFLQIHMKDVKSPPTYEALVLVGYNHELGQYVVFWLDNFGGKFSEKGTGTREGDLLNSYSRIQMVWCITHSPGTQRVQTWVSLIEQQDENGQWSVFAEDRLQRL